MFIKESFVDLLNELTGAQESIEKVSVWIQQYRDQAPIIAQAWKGFYFEATPEKKLTLLFLVNDVLQHSKRKGPQFVDAFGHILPKCMAECKKSESKTQIERMLDIWESREVFHKHIISAMKYNLDDIGLEDAYVKLTDLMDSLDLLRSHEKKSSEVLTKLSHRLDTTDFANAFNVTSRKEGDKYAADFDETAHFLDQYCSCLLKQTEARSDLIKKINSTMFQMEKSEEAIKNLDKEYKTQQGTLVRTRKAITSRLMLIDEGMVNFGDDSPGREEIENLTSEEEDVDIEGIETFEYQKVEQLDISGRIFARFVSFCLSLEGNPIFQSILERYDICKECCPIAWICVFYLSVRSIVLAALKSLKDSDKSSNADCSAIEKPLNMIGFKVDVGSLVKSMPSAYHVYVMTGRYGLPSLPSNNSNSSSHSSQNYGPRLPSNNNASSNKFGPALPNQSVDKFGPSLPSTLPSDSFGPALPSTTPFQGLYGPALPVSQSGVTHAPALPPSLGNLVNNPDKFGPPLPIQKYPTFGPALPPNPVFSSFPTDVGADDKKFGPALPKAGPPLPSKSKAKGLPSVPNKCHTSIERLLLLYNTDPEVIEGSETNLQQVFGGAARGYFPKEEDSEPKIISNSLSLSPKKDKLPEDQSEQPMVNVLEPILKAYIGSFEPPKFSSFPTDVVAAVIKGKVENSRNNSGQIESHEKRGHSPTHRRHSPYRKHSPHRDRKQSPHRDSHNRSPHRRHSPQHERRHSPQRERRHSPQRERRHSPPHGKDVQRSRSDSGRKNDRDRGPGPICPPGSQPMGMSSQSIGMGSQPMGLGSQPMGLGPPMGMVPPLPSLNVISPNSFGPPIPPNNMQENRFSSPMPPENRFGPPMPQNNMQQNRFGPPMPPNNRQRNRFGPPMPPNTMPMMNIQGPNNFGPFSPPGNNFPPMMNQNFPPGPGMRGPGPMSNMMGRPPMGFNGNFPPQQRMMQPGSFRPR